MGKRVRAKRVRPLDGRQYLGGWRSSYADGCAAVDKDIERKRENPDCFPIIPQCEPKAMAAKLNALRAINPETEKRLRMVYTTHSKPFWDGVYSRRKELSLDADLHHKQETLLMNELERICPKHIIDKFLRSGGSARQLLVALQVRKG